MEEPDSRATLRELVPLTDSLASRIRWRVCDYAALFSAELELMLDPGSTADEVPRGRGAELRSEIRLLAGGARRAALPAAASGSEDGRPSHRKGARR